MPSTRNEICHCFRLFPFLCHVDWLIWMTAVGSSAFFVSKGAVLPRAQPPCFFSTSVGSSWGNVERGWSPMQNMALNKHQSVHTHLSWHNSLVQWNMTLSLRYPFYHPIFLWSITVAGWVRTTPLQNLPSSIIHPCLIKVYLHSSSNLFLSIHHHVIHR